MDDAFGPHVPVCRELGGTHRGRAWLAGLPGLVTDLEQEWGIDTGSPYTDGVAAWTAPATWPDGSDAVLKVSWPHREARGEAEALRFWEGDGAVRVLRSDHHRYALLLERCRPGSALGGSRGSAEERLTAAASILRRLWSRRPIAGLALEVLGDVTAEWAATVHERHERLGRPFDHGLVALGVELLTGLPTTSTRDVVVHGDFNPGNVLSAQREPWLAIDPKPMIGDPTYDPWPLLVQLDSPFERPNPSATLLARYRRFADQVQEPAERLLRWSVARTIESACCELERGSGAAAQTQMAEAACLAALADL